MNSIFLFIETILMTWIFLILPSVVRWHIFWCYTDIWVNFKESKDNFLLYLVKLKVAFKNTIFWCWIWALIHTNHFFNLELIEFKAYSAPKYLSIRFSNVRRFFQKISIIYNLGQNCWGKIENQFFSEKNLSSQINVVHKVLGFWQQNLARFNIEPG